MFLELIPELLFGGSTVLLVGGVFAPTIKNKFFISTSKEEIEDMKKLGYSEVNDMSQVDGIIEDLNKLFKLPDGAVRPKYSLEYYTLLYEIQNKKQLNRDVYISPIDLKEIDKKSIEMLSDKDRLYNLSREINVTRLLSREETLDWVKKLANMKDIRNISLKNHFLETYMEKTKENRIKYMDNTEDVLLGDEKISRLIDIQEKKFKDVNSQVNDLLSKNVI